MSDSSAVLPVIPASSAPTAKALQVLPRGRETFRVPMMGAVPGVDVFFVLSGFGPLSLMLARFAATFAAATLSWFVVERPFLRWKAQLSATRGKR